MALKTLLPLLIFCMVDGWSTFHKSDKVYLNFYEESVLPIKECKDKLQPEFCAKYEKLCFEVPKLTKMCKKTCGDCPAVSPMSCKATKWGCCWDNITTSGAFGKGCPECRDRLGRCSKAAGICHLVEIQRACPITCQVKACFTGTCYDDPSQAPFCGQFKKAKLCEIDKPLMKRFCEKTCDLCDDDASGKVIQSKKSDKGVAAEKLRSDETLLRMLIDE